MPQPSRCCILRSRFTQEGPVDQRDWLIFRPADRCPAGTYDLGRALGRLRIVSSFGKPDLRSHPLACTWLLNAVIARMLSEPHMPSASPRIGIRRTGGKQKYSRAQAFYGGGSPQGAPAQPVSIRGKLPWMAPLGGSHPGSVCPDASSSPACQDAMDQTVSRGRPVERNASAPLVFTGLKPIS
jgi:hypothetical protein